MAEKNINAQINVEFEEAASRQSLDSGDSVNTLFGKIKKFFSDLKAVAFSGSYNDLSDSPDLSTKLDKTDPVATNSFTLGNRTTQPDYATTGVNSIAIGNNTAAMSYGCVAIGDNAKAEGTGTFVLGSGATSVGSETYGSVVFHGQNTGRKSFCYRGATKGNYSISFWGNTYGTDSVAIGRGTTAYEKQVVLGQYNKPDEESKYSLILGGGEDTYLNLFTIDKSGNGVFTGSVEATNLHNTVWATCSSAADSIEKEAILDDSTYTLKENDILYILFKTSNTAAYDSENPLTMKIGEESYRILSKENTYANGSITYWGYENYYCWYRVEKESKRLICLGHSWDNNTASGFSTQGTTTSETVTLGWKPASVIIANEAGAVFPPTSITSTGFVCTTIPEGTTRNYWAFK